MPHDKCYMDILGVRIDNLTKKEILEKIEFFLSEDKFHQIATVNPEFVLKAQEDKEFKNILNGCSLNIADGVGIWYAFIRNFSYLKKRFAGVDLLDEIFKVANKNNLNVYLAINGNGLSKYNEVKDAVLKKYPNLHINGMDMDIKSYLSSVIHHQRLSLHDDRLLMTDCQILICNFGAPFQEMFLNSQKNGKIRLAIGVGGSFDFMTGKVKRAPRLMRILGLEWLWRSFFHPSTDRKFILNRIKRIANAIIIFPIRVTLGK